jgi:hypothetical protein
MIAILASLQPAVDKKDEPGKKDLS